MSDEKIDNVSVFECKCGCKIEHMVYEDDECPYCGSMRNEFGFGCDNGDDGIHVIINKDLNIRYVSIGNFTEECKYLKDKNHSCLHCEEECEYFIPCPLCTNDEIYDTPFEFSPVGWFENGRKEEDIVSKYNEIDKYTENGMAEKLRSCYSAGCMNKITVRGVNQVEVEQGCKFCNGTGKVDWIQNITKDRKTDDEK